MAEDLLVIGINKSVQGVTNLSTAQLRAIYKGDIANWTELGGPAAAIVVLDRPEDQNSKKTLRKYYLEKDKTTDKAIILNKEDGIIETLKSAPYTIGAFSLSTSLIDQSLVTFLNLNDVAPTLKNFKTGQYPMARQLGLVWHKAPKPATQKFIDFIFSPEGIQLIQEQGLIPAK